VNRTSLFSRRTFLRVGLGATGACYAAVIGYPLYEYLATPAQQAAASAGAIKEISLDGADKLPRNAAMMFKFGGQPAILIHHADGRWSAFSAVCTHLGCTVQFEAEKNRIYCACHGGIYDPETGRNVSGPPPKPLLSFHAEAVNGKVVVSRG
jgi:cytochrome b6-f complex iron-sulfur subunit